MDISFNFPSTISLRKRAALKEFIAAIFQKERQKASSLNVIFCSDDFILGINKTYLHHNYFTDIITFDLSANRSDGIEGEIYISTDTVRSNALRFGTTITNELHRVLFHGVLHLCGYADKTEKEQASMTSKENFYLNLYFKD
jgi:rRNA maturation RNase YbeY